MSEYNTLSAELDWLVRRVEELEQSVTGTAPNLSDAPPWKVPIRPNIPKGRPLSRLEWETIAAQWDDLNLANRQQEQGSREQED